MNEQTVSDNVYQSPVAYHDSVATTPVSVVTDTYGTVTQDTYSVQEQVRAGLSDFYEQHVEGSIQVFHSLTLGEILIIILLALIALTLIAKWIWEVI